MRMPLVRISSITARCTQKRISSQNPQKQNSSTQVAHFVATVARHSRSTSNFDNSTHQQPHSLVQLTAHGATNIGGYIQTFDHLSASRIPEFKSHLGRFPPHEAFCHQTFNGFVQTKPLKIPLRSTVHNPFQHSTILIGLQRFLLQAP